jgi:hypothetical protein
VFTAALGSLLLGACSNSRASSSRVSSLVAHASQPVAAGAATVPCGDAIGTTPSGTADGYRVILGAVSVPAPFLPQVVATPGEAWPYWRKAGIAVRLSRIPATVSVPPGWRAKVAITWGGVGAVSALRFVPCPSTSSQWQGYAGGFHIRSRTECVPLAIGVGPRVQVVHFGIGRPCASARRR